MRELVPTTPEMWRELFDALDKELFAAPMLDAIEKLANDEADVRVKPKPTTQTLGVSGMSTGAVGARYGSPPRWSQLAGLPPFQMFMRERAEFDPEMDTDVWATHAATQLARTIGDDQLIEDYCTWHERKGLWPRETPYGQIKE